MTGHARAIVGALAATLAAGAPAAEVPGERPPGLELTGNLSRVHDPTIIRVDDRYFVFATGQARDDTGLVPVRVSSDLLNWEHRGAVFPAIPAWAAERVPGTRGIWAPDISHQPRRIQALLFDLDLRAEPVGDRPDRQQRRSIRRRRAPAGPIAGR